MTTQNIPIACDLGALSDPERHAAVGEQLMEQALSVRPLEAGYQIGFPVTALTLVAEFIDGERQCCPFLQFSVRVPPAAQHVYLQLTGRDGVKSYLEQELLPHLNYEG